MVKNGNIIGIKEILSHLFLKYFKNTSEHSNVTSSYWRNVGVNEVSINLDGEYDLSGYAFGGYTKKTFLNYLKQIPYNILLKNMFNQYNLSKIYLKKMEEILDKYGFSQSVDSYKQITSYSKVMEVLKDKKYFEDHQKKCVCIIGDGYGFLTSFIHLIDPQTKIICINLGRTLFFDVFYSSKNFSDTNTILLDCEKNKRDFLDNANIVFIEAENYKLLENLPIDLFINIASMQEMNPDIINNYFKFMRKSSSSSCFFYCCNRQYKELPDGTEIVFANYPWAEKDIILFDELCPWYQKSPSLRPPFYHKYDGPIQHRLVKLYK